MDFFLIKSSQSRSKISRKSHKGDPLPFAYQILFISSSDLEWSKVTTNNNTQSI